MSCCVGTPKSSSISGHLPVRLIARDAAVAHAHDAVRPAATAGSWVTRTKVSPSLAFSLQEVHDPLAVLESSAPVGSSAQIRAGLLTSERAMVTRWRWPPESSAGRLFA